jgi:ArsR family transcriptional regulator, arsenate/arsenite/antimonite-responsive transcriptional repressor
LETKKKLDICFSAHYYVDVLKHIISPQALFDLCPAEECGELLRALTDETRQQIIALFFTHKELCVSDIADNFKLSRPTISHHLNLMKRAKLLKARKEGKAIYYSFNRGHVTKLMESIVDSLKKCC